jgi:hypothetical protein
MGSKQYSGMAYVDSAIWGAFLKVMSELTVGAKAPLFSLQDQDEKTISLADLKGKSVVLYFYPKHVPRRALRFPEEGRGGARRQPR